MTDARRLLVLLYGAAALTGQAGSIIWMKRLALVMGGTVTAVAAVLTVILSGYAIGGLVVGRYGRDDWNVTRRFAGIQVFLGAWFLALPVLFDRVESVYAAVAPPVDTPGHAALRVALTIPILLPPAAAMGAVFPLVSAAGVSRVFAAGVSGSLAGVLIATLLMLPGFGVAGSLVRLGAANGIVGLAAWLLPAVRLAKPESVSHGPAGRACLTGAALGIALFLAEILWLRLVFLVVDQTAYAEGIVVGAVFLAMAGGALWASHPKPALPVVLVATAVAQCLLIPGMVWLARGWNGLARDASFPVFLLLEFLLATAVVGLPSIGYGLAVPRLCAGLCPRAVGRVWAAHYLGGMVASLLAPFAVIPAIGMTAALALASTVLALPLLLDRRWAHAATVLVVSAVAASGDVTYRSEAAGREERILLHRDDGDGLVEVFERIDDGTRSLLSSRRRQEGGDGPEQVAVERLMGCLPVLLHGTAREVLVVGLGTGVTVGAMLGDPQIRRLTCVEISPGVMDAAPFFDRASGGALHDPRARYVVQDGRSFIRLTRDRFDLILQELFFAYRAGVGSLYADEHYRRCRDRLAPGGRMAQWISLAQIGPEELRSVVRTFQGVFPHTSLWRSRAYLMLLGGDRPLVPPAVAELRHFLAADDAVAAWAAGAPINTEDNLLVEYQAPRMFRWLNTFELVIGNLRGLAAIRQDATVLAHGLPAGPSAGARRLLEGMLAQAEGDLETARLALRGALEADPGNDEARQLLMSLAGAR